MSEPSTISLLLANATVSAIVSAGISAAISIHIFRRSSKNNELDAIYSQIQQLNTLAIEYPYFEDDNFCSGWSCDAVDDNSMRYDNYCCIVFNLLERIWRHLDGDKSRIFNFIHFGELAQRHKVWWQQLDNIRGYDKGFREFVGEYQSGGS